MRTVTSVSFNDVKADIRAGKVNLDGLSSARCSLKMALLDMPASLFVRDEFLEGNGRTYSINLNKLGKKFRPLEAFNPKEQAKISEYLELHEAMYALVAKETMVKIEAARPNPEVSASEIKVLVDELHNNVRNAGGFSDALITEANYATLRREFGMKPRAINL